MNIISTVFKNCSDDKREKKLFSKERIKATEKDKLRQRLISEQVIWTYSQGAQAVRRHLSQTLHVKCVLIFLVWMSQTSVKRHIVMKNTHKMIPESQTVTKESQKSPQIDTKWPQKKTQKLLKRGKNDEKEMQNKQHETKTWQHTTWQPHLWWFKLSVLGGGS